MAKQDRKSMMADSSEQNAPQKRRGAPINWNWIAVLVSILLLSWLAAKEGYRVQFTFESNVTSAQAATP